MVLALLYIIPAVSILFMPFGRFVRFGKIHAFAGRIEWLLSFFRDVLLSLIFIVYSVYNTVEAVFLGKEFHWETSLFMLAALGLSLFAFLNRRRRLRIFLDYIKETGPIRPEVFFKLYYAIISNLPGYLPDAKEYILTCPINYKNGSRTVSLWPIVPGILNTALATNFVVRASKWRGKEFCRDIADIVATIWGARFIQLAKCSFTLEGVERLKDIKGRSLFLPNHKSFTDFLIVPLAIGLINMDRSHPFYPRYMAARDHFLDNPFLYRILGLGRAMQEIGTVFVDRKSKKESPRHAVDVALKAIDRENVDITMFPQGTRAHGNRDREGNRISAGYYTTGKSDKLLEPLGHLKKGAAYLSVDVAGNFTSRGKAFNIIPLGLMGTGILCPRKELKIQRGVDLKVVVGHPITFKSGDVDKISLSTLDGEEFSGSRREMVEEMHVKIDKSLKEVSGVHNELLRRIINDIRRIDKEDGTERFMVALDGWKIDEDLIYSTIDCIYSSPADMWDNFVTRFFDLITEGDTPREEILHFKEIVVGEMMKKR